MSKTEIELAGLEAPPAGDWEIDAVHSNVTFTARYMMLSKVRGRFGSYAGTIHVGEIPEDSSVEVTIEAASIDTNNAMRDDHLRSPDFLDVERYPTLAFRSTKVERTGDTLLRVSGDLTIRDVTRPIVLEVEYDGYERRDLLDRSRIAFTATTEIDREEFGITWNQALETGGVLVGKTVGIELEIQAVRPAAERSEQAVA
jgi:polyisoprenoid-binding protein YceI